MVDKDQLQKLGAKVRLKELDEERTALIKLLNGRQPAAAKTNGEAAPRKSHLSAKGRKNLSMKLKAYWAKRKAEGEPAGKKK